MTKNREKVIHIHDTCTETGYISNKPGKFIFHSFDDEPATIWNDGHKSWYKDGLRHRDNNLPAVIWSDGYNSYYKNDEIYWFINGEEYYDIDEVKEKFKNNILNLPNVNNNNNNILKENGIDTICIDYCNYLILDQSQYNLAVFKFL